MEKIWDKETVRENLLRSDKWVYRAVVALYNRQTDEEKVISDTKDRNFRGFNAFDAEILTSFADQIQQWESCGYNKYQNPLSRKQMAIARKKVLKYSGQLARIANGEL